MGKNSSKNSYCLGKNSWKKWSTSCRLFIGGFHFGINEENLLCAKESAKRVLTDVYRIGRKKETLTKENVNEIARILDNSNTELRKIIEEINGENQHRIF